MTNFIIGQIISILGLIASIVVVQFKDIKSILLGEMVANLLVALSYIFLGGLSGAWICIAATLQTIVLFVANKRSVMGQMRNAIMVIFIAIYVIGTAVVYQGWGDMVSCACALLYVMAVMQTQSSRYRLFMTANSVLWIIYDLSVSAYGNLITHGLVLVSTVSAIVYLDWKIKKSRGWDKK